MGAEEVPLLHRIRGPFPLGEGLLLSSCVARCVVGIVKESPGSRDPAGALGRWSMLETSTAAIAG